MVKVVEDNKFRKMFEELENDPDDHRELKEIEKMEKGETNRQKTRGDLCHED